MEGDPHVSPGGAKGIGELWIVDTAAAISSAVAHATGIRVCDWPITLDKHRQRNTNYLWTLSMSRAFAPILKGNGGGALVNMLSVVSWYNYPLNGSYCAPKAAEWSMTNGIRIELRAQGTLVIGVYAGWMATEMATQTNAPKSRPEDIAVRTMRPLRLAVRRCLQISGARRSRRRSRETHKLSLARCTSSGTGACDWYYERFQKQWTSNVVCGQTWLFPLFDSLPLVVVHLFQCLDTSGVCRQGPQARRSCGKQLEWVCLRSHSRDTHKRRKPIWMSQDPWALIKTKSAVSAALPARLLALARQARRSLKCEIIWRLEHALAARERRKLDATTSSNM